MKKNILALLITILFSMINSNCFAQDENSFGFFIASPVGKFKSTDLESGGFAKQGWGVVFDSKNKFDFLPKNWSLYFHSTYQWNEMDTEAVAQKFTEQLGYKTTVSDSKYSPLITTIGPAYDFSIGEKVKIGLNGALGIMFTNTKAMTIHVYDTNNNLILSEIVNFDNKIAFTYTFGTEIKYEIIKDLLRFSIYTDYTAANQKTEVSFTNAESTDSFQKLQYFNTGFKLAFLKK